MPLVSIFQLMIPGYVLGLISLNVFFQVSGIEGIGDRLAAIATIMLA